MLRLALITAAATLLSSPACLSQTGNSSIDCPDVAIEGGTLTITVGPNDTTLEVQDAAGTVITIRSVTPGKDVNLTVPPNLAGNCLVVVLGNRERKRAKFVEVLQLSP